MNKKASQKILEQAEQKLLALKDKLFTVVDYKRTLPSRKVHTTKQIIN